MKSIVLYEPGYGGQRKEDIASIKSKNNGIKKARTRARLVKKDDSPPDIEICLVVGNEVNGGEKTEMKKDESNKAEEEEEEEEEKSSPGVDCAVGESVEASHGSGETFRDDEDIEILSCSIATRGSQKSKSPESCTKDGSCEKSNESVVKDSNSSSQCQLNLESELGTKENGVSDSETAVGSVPCTADDKDRESFEKPSGNSEQGGADAGKSESDRVTEGNPGSVPSDPSAVPEKDIHDEKMEDEFGTEETESNSRGKQSSDEGFMEEEENKENRSDEGREATVGNAKTRRRENGGKTPVLECVEITWESEENLKSSWNKEKTDIYGSQESNGRDVFLVEAEMDVDLIADGKNEECNDSEEENAPVSSSEEIADANGKAEGETAEEVECCVDVHEEKSEERGKSEEELMQKRKRRSVDGEEAVKSSVKKRRTKSFESCKSELKRRHSFDAAFTDNTTSTSCHDSADNESEGESSKVERDGSKKNTLKESIDRVASAQTSLPFLESLRGTIKTLSRSDLEELIVQKLCEVITERSTVGVLRKKAQALEQDQERWKEKVHQLTKQLREMDMVMKKYMSEVQKQSKERNFQMVTPLRVTRSVGLQVSFGSSSSKLSKVVTNSNQARQPVLPASEKAVQQPQQHIAKKNVPILPYSQGKKPLKEHKKQFSPRPGVNVTLQARLISPQTMVTSNGAIQAQVNALNVPRLPALDQSNSKIIDLTDDDDRQNGHTMPKTILQSGVTVRPPSQIRVVNHIQPTPVNSAGRVAYLVPATTATATGSTVPPHGRQLLIATPTVQPPPRQLLPSVPPLLYKGSTILQPGTQQQSLINQTNRALMPKPLKHPAPLPQPPTNQVQKPNLKLLPPRPALKISKVQTGIVLSWNMVLGPEYEPIASYQLYAYQENNSPPKTSLWKKVGDVKALPLPMACTLTQFMSGHKYYFAVRAVDLHSRIGPFSFPGSIVLIK